MGSLIDHIVSESGLDERTPERLIMAHNGDYVELSGPLVFRRVIYAHNPDYSVFLPISDTVVEIADGETYMQELTEPTAPVDGAEYRDIYILAVPEEGWLGIPSWVLPVAIGASVTALVVIGVVYGFSRK